MLTKNMVLIGGGNMGSALLKGILKARLTSPKKITVVDVHTGKLEELKRIYKVHTTSDPVGPVSRSKLIILAVKPQTLTGVLDRIREAVKPDQLIISIVAGVESTYIRDRLGQNNPVIRVMPNIAATVDAAASALSGCEPAAEEHFKAAEAIFGAVGEVVRIEEQHLDAVTGLSGSGPAYIYMVIEALCDGGVKMGIPREIAMKLATQTVFGAAKLVKETGQHPATLKDQVTTPGGTTISAIHELERHGLRSMLISAVETATHHSESRTRALLAKFGAEPRG